jgi:glycogen operon protein
VPLLLGGDELGRTQLGNNNAYCQDNELVWFDWSAVDADLLDFTRRLIALRRATPGVPPTALPRRVRPLGAGLVHAGRHAHDLRELGRSQRRCLTIHLDGTSDPDRNEDGTPELDDDFLVLVNGWWEP